MVNERGQRKVTGLGPSNSSQAGRIIRVFVGPDYPVWSLGVALVVLQRRGRIIRFFGEAGLSGGDRLSGVRPDIPPWSLGVALEVLSGILAMAGLSGAWRGRIIR